MIEGWIFRELNMAPLGASRCCLQVKECRCPARGLVRQIRVVVVVGVVVVVVVVVGHPGRQPRRANEHSQTSLALKWAWARGTVGWDWAKEWRHQECWGQWRSQR